MNAALRPDPESRPITPDHREAARGWVDEHVSQIRDAFGFVTLRRYDTPQPAYGIHEVTGLRVTPRGAALTSTVVGLVSPLITDEFLARYRYENPLVSTITWKHMSPSLQALIASASILPVEWKNRELLAGDYLDSRIRFTAVTSVLRFLTA